MAANKRAYICEFCFGKNYMTRSEYEARSTAGLVFCANCRPNVRLKTFPFPKRFTAANLR
jgi:hypothetical protein